MTKEIRDEIERLISKLKQDQLEDGSWDYPFETGLITDAYMIILLKLLGREEAELIKGLAERIESRQEENGAWKLFRDERDGNASLSIECYYALLFSGIRKKSDPGMIRARRFIMSRGGLASAGMYTKILLALTGQYKWPAVFPVPLEAILLPSSFIVSIYDISVFGRSNIIPILVLGNRKFQMIVPDTPDLTHLKDGQRDSEWEEFRSGEARSLFGAVAGGVKALAGLPGHLRRLAEDAALKYMTGHIEADGTLYNYFSSTFYMILAIIALGAPKEDKVIMAALAGLKGMACRIEGKLHMQYTTANVWNTALISHALQEGGVTHTESAVEKANLYLRSRQHHQYGDWMIRNPSALPGGWGFSDLNRINPDVDDTTASLRAVYGNRASVDEGWRRGLQYTVSMQNDDGGWPAFERNVDKKLLHLLPIQGAEFILTDPSTPDLTGRTLEFLGNYVNQKLPGFSIKSAVKWLYRHQEANGSWYGRWGICYIYGTWAALTGLTAAGESPRSARILRAEKWLQKVQNEDGGWGESCLSDIHKTYIPLQASTLTHTAWALDALVSVKEEPDAGVRKAVSYLIKHGRDEDWTSRYPAGQGMAGFFYIHYHSYRHVFPLLALSHYLNKFH
ncbi:prenyltransferase/squalene oxidase repeat-containing protein [Peribacillus sp. SCS-26]|uniref:terpene cyclase/mutase family protein n=1 Tax=Paraperibacillus marinus TaxID=3115295 RepID=UPI0039060939